MDKKRQRRDSISYANLFDLESVVDVQLQQRDEDFDYYGTDTQVGAMTKYGNGVVSSKDLSLGKKKKKLLYDSGNEEETGYYGSHITEDRYRAMLEEHALKYKRRSKDTSASPAETKTESLIPKNKNLASKSWKSGNAHKGGVREVETSEWHNDSSSQKPWNCSEADLISDYETDRMMSEPAYLDIGDGITYNIPPTYDKLMPMLNMPCLSDIKVEEFYLKGTLDLGSLAAMMASDKRLGSGKRAGMGEPQVQNETLQAKLKALPGSSSGQKFSLKISCAGLNSSIPEGAAGKNRRFILSEGGVLQVFYVKVIEKGDAYEIIERSLPKEEKVEKDPSMIERGEMERIGMVWVNITKRDIPKHHKSFTAFHRKQQIDAKRFSENCQREVKMKVNRSTKLMRGAAIRTRKLARDMLLFWKRKDKEMAEVKKREEREAAEALRREQEIREAERQKSRLEYLIKQTEIFSHFMQNKFNSEPGEALPAGEAIDQEADLNFSDVMLNEEEDPEMAELKLKALTAAQNAASKQKEITNAFDTECLKLRQDSGTDASLQDISVAGSSNIDLRNPSTMPATSTVQTPELFKGCLKEYQLKGLQWLVNCYEQGLNGILADEMGLGKTIQAMVFLAHLAEEKNIWGPFLVVAPASVLNNWADEIGRFCPDLKTLPYWGGLQERVILRKNINPKRLYRREAGFHILITSYQLLVSDEKYFRRVKWQYMVLDEAQAIKSANSIRWKTLLSFNCRNRLLLTGTPIQNNMAELWALLHFIMPTLFDSHEQFNEWFSKGIESHAEHGGALNEHQLNRLHKILKPFMLRRLKKDVVSELTRKTEVTVHCKLSSRQQAFYQAIKNKISLVELFDGSRGHLNERKIMNLMNIVIQLRKVCNHPELFERNEGSTYLYFGEIPNSPLPPPFGELEDIHYPGGYNHIVYQVPKLVYQEIIQSPYIYSSASWHGICRESFHKYFNIFSPENGYRSVLPIDSDGLLIKSGTFGFTRLIDLSTSELAFIANSSFMERLLFSIIKWDRQYLDGILDSIMESTADDHNSCNINRGKFRAVTRMLLMPSRTETSSHKMKRATGLDHAPFEALVISHQERLLSNARLLSSIYTSIPRTRAPPINAACSDRNFAYKMIEELHQPWLKRLLVGFARTSDCNGPRKPNTPHHLIQEIDSELPVSQPALQLTHKIFGSSPPMQSFDPAKLLTDSGKLQTLDILLRRLRAENHRVLLFTQMTKMLNILEDYMNYRKYRYLRLDGSSTIMDRRDMVKDFQHRNDIFVFLLSTRAGGLGINLTAADTVIFYESDWNPTLDLQAMDRAHRLGQTKDVTVYRLVCKETVEEKILQRASQKNTVQQLVMTGGHVQSDLLAPEDVVSLLLDDAQLEQKLKESVPQVKDRQKKKYPTKSIRIDDDGDVFLEELTNTGSPANGLELTLEPEKTKSGNKKRKAVATSNKQTQPKPRNPQKTNEASPALTDYEPEDPLRNTNPKLKKPKRPKKTVKGNLEPNFTNHRAPSQQLGSAEQDL